MRFEIYLISEWFIISITPAIISVILRLNKIQLKEVAGKTSIRLNFLFLISEEHTCCEAHFSGAYISIRVTFLYFYRSMEIGARFLRALFVSGAWHCIRPETLRQTADARVLRVLWALSFCNFHKLLFILYLFIAYVIYFVYFIFSYEYKMYKMRKIGYFRLISI